MKPSFASKRLQDESYKDYVARRKYISKAIKQHSKGRVLHDSSKRGVYRKPKAVQ